MTVASPEMCPNCGAERPTNAPRGLCPRCLLQWGLASDVAELAPADGSHATHDRAGAASVVETLAATFGPVPRVLLRDTDPGAESPVLRPGSPEMPPLAERSARLHLLGEIARGGMGAVLKGRDVDLGRDLAVKVLLETHRDKPELVHRFIEEAQIAGQLQHPGIAPIYELGVFADRRPYFTMKLVKGRTLAELLCDRGDGGEPQLLGIFESVCQTVAYAHARGVIHRDLKPSNVMVGNFGEVQVMDWGLAKVLLRGGVAADATAGKVADDTVIVTARSGQSDSDADLSRAGSVMGTPSYMAPEQARGDVGLVDERADVFALGSILCEILTGQPALTGRTSAEIQRLAARGEILLVNGQFTEALPDLERTRAQLAELEGQSFREKRIAALIPPVRWLVDHEAELAALTADRPRVRAELTCLDLATLAQRAGRPALAARLYHVAFAASPTLADGRRPDAARAAGGGQGEDHPPLDGAAKAMLRRHALDWLKDDLAALSRSLDPADPRSRATVTETLDHWKSDPDLAGVGGTKALGALPEDERREWRAFWSQVETLGKKAGGGAP